MRALQIGPILGCNCQGGWKWCLELINLRDFLSFLCEISNYCEYYLYLEFSRLGRSGTYSHLSAVLLWLQNVYLNADVSAWDTLRMSFLYLLSAFLFYSGVLILLLIPFFSLFA